jgi:hypothetical protein
MKGSKVRTVKHNSDAIHVTKLKGIQLHFPGDIYALAVWTAMSDRARSSPAAKIQTTLQGLASKFVSMYGLDYANPITKADVMDRFVKHGIKGNPALCLEDDEEPTLVVQWNDAV